MLNITNFFVTLAEDQTTTENVGMDLIRLIFGVLSRYVYDFIAKITDIFYDIALVLNVNGEGISKLANSITDKLFIVILIYMIFRGTITMLSYLVDPESFQDKAKGGATFIKKILISIVLLISINPIFNLLGTIQADIIDSDIVTNLFNGNKTNTVFETNGGQTIYFMSMSPRCDDGYLVATFSKGEHLSLETLKPFIQPYGQTDMANLIGEPVYYCGADMTDLFNGNYNDFKYIDSDPDSTYQTMSGILSPRTSAMEYLGPSVYNSTNGTWPDQHEYNIDFNFFFCLVVGIVILLVLISFTFDVVIRAFNLVVLKVLAPVPIIAYMSPKGKDAEMLGIWIKKVISTWVSLFIRLIALEFALAIISIICDGGVLPDNSFGFIESLFVIFGALMFAKKLPQLLEEIIPGFKGVGNFELNPFKRISNEALGGKAALGLAAGAGAMALGAATNFGQRAIETGQNVANAQGAGARARALGGGLLRTAGSTIAGGTRAGINAFNRTRKDGNMFGGLWKGYGTAMFSKKQREDNLRKAGILNDDGTYAEGKGFKDSFGFGMQSLAADAARYVGVMNAGQREILDAAAQDKLIESWQKQLADRKRQDAESKAKELKPYDLYTSQAVNIQNRLKVLVDNDDEVKKAQSMYDEALATGQDVSTAQNLLKEAKKVATNKFLSNSSLDSTGILKERMDKLEKLREDYLELKKYDLYTTGKYGKEFNDDILASVQYKQETISNKYKGYEAQYAAEERRIEEYKNSEAVVRAHNENSEAKLANASRLNTEVEGPGFKPATSGSSQSEITDEARFHLGRNANMASRARTTGGSGTNPPPPPPPPGGALH